MLNYRFLLHAYWRLWELSPCGAWSTYELVGLALLFVQFQQTIGFSALHYGNHYHFNIRIYYPSRGTKRFGGSSYGIWEQISD
jgi:hypothetical protein